MNADVEKAAEALKWLVGHTDVRAIGHIVTLRQALRDQEAVLRECDTIIRKLCACHGHPLPQATLDRITAHLGGEHE